MNWLSGAGDRLPTLVTEITLKSKMLFAEYPIGTIKAVEAVQNFKLKDFLGPSNKGCIVISTSDPTGGNGPLLSDLVYRDTKIVKLCFDLAPNGVTVMQSDRDAFLTTPKLKNISWFGGLIVGAIVNAIWGDVVDKYGVLGLCKVLIPIEMHAAPAKIMIDDWATPVDMDMIQDDQCLTLPLAGSLARLMMRYPDRFDPPVIAVYGGQRVTDKAKLRSIYDAARDKSSFPVNNDTVGPDPWKGMRKFCVAYCLTENSKMSTGKYCVGRSALEGKSMDFDGEFLAGSFHGQELRDSKSRKTYWSFQLALQNKLSWAIEMPNLGYNPPGDDPAPGVVKKAIVEVGKGTGSQQRKGRYNLTEGTIVDPWNMLEFDPSGGIHVGVRA